METVHSVRIDHGPVQTSAMPYTQRNSTHRPSHSQQSELYKPSRSPLASAARYPYPTASPQQQHPQPPPGSGPGGGGAIQQHQSSQQQHQSPHHHQQSQQPHPQLSQPQSQPQQPPPPPQQQRYVVPPHSSFAPVPAPTGFREYRQPRISLLHSEYAARSSGNIMGRDALPGGAQLHHVATAPTAVHDQILGGGGMGGGGGQPCKKMRLQDQKEMLPLRIETRQESSGVYNPQVEAISPTLPDHIQQEDQAFRSTKDELLQQIGKVDREIAKTESQIGILKKKQAELEELALKPIMKSEVEEDNQPKHQSLAQKIYAENRKKAQTAHAQLDSLGPKVEFPLYNQPSDTTVYHENKRKYLTFKKRILEYFKKQHLEKEQRNTILAETYSKLMQEWLRKVDKIESSAKRKGKEAKNREFFEKVFPELRKQREDKERFNRVGARIKSEADLEEIMDNLQEQALEDKKMRSYAVIPPILKDARERKLTYQNKNGHIVDMEIEYKSRQFLNVWTPSEKEVFKEKYLQHPKNFCVISSYLDRKNVSDCVQYYYLSKKTENYKQLLRKSRQRTRSSRNNTQKVNNAAATGVDVTTGVTTRFQREQQQKTVVQGVNNRGEQGTETITITTCTTTIISTSTTIITTTSVSSPSSADNSGAATICSPSSANVASAANATATSSGSLVLSASDRSSPATATSPTATATTSAMVGTQSSLICAPGSGGVATAAISAGGEGAGGVARSPKGGEEGMTGSVATEGGNVASEKGEKMFNDFNSFEEYRANCVSGENGGEGKDGGSERVNEAHTGAQQLQGVNGLKKEEGGMQENCISDQNSTSVGLVENKKKKERRKDKENTVIESSEDETVDIQDKLSQGGACIVCGMQLSAGLQSRPLAPSQASQYGLREDQVPPSGRVCNTCWCKRVRSRCTHCPLPMCPSARGRVKRLRSFPHRFQELPADVRESILAEFNIPSGVTKCCSACFNRIQRRLGPVEDWPEDEVNQLRNALTEIGANWQMIGERLNRPPHQIRSFYSMNRKRLSLENCLGDRKPSLTDEEESGSSTSSCEEPCRERHSSDTASAESPQTNGEQHPLQSTVKKEDYDSSATETADEGQTPDHYSSTATVTVVSSDGQLRQNNSPLTVKDLMLNVIEISLMKNSGAQQPHPPTSVVTGMTPTISSILNNDSNEVTIVSEYNLSTAQPPRNTNRNEVSITKLVTPLIAATITPVPAPGQVPPQMQDHVPRDDLMVLQVQDNRVGEPETLDLSLKKPRDPGPPIHPKHAQPPVSHRSDQPSAYMAYHQERKSPAVYVSSVPSRVQPKLPSPKPANPKAGSITLGTPIISQPRFEGLLRQITPEPKMGSITQGTPIHVPHMQDKRVYEYYNKRPPMPPQSMTSQSGGYPPPQYRQPAYSVDQQLSSRQIIMNDYITSQQMLGRRNAVSDKAAAVAAAQYYVRTPPPPQPTAVSAAVVTQQQQQQRQGVIQRHNTQQPSSRPHYPPGHEALGSLVDVAVQQPSLPVPPSAPHEGLGKTMVDNLMEQPRRFQMMEQHQQQLRQQQQQQQRLEAERRFHQQQQQQQQQLRHQQQVSRSDSSTLTAASLIDAIITHQINQPAEVNKPRFFLQGGQSVPNAREPARASDRLFQSFHREQALAQQQQQQQQQQSQDNNGERPPSVISVDLDSEPGNKNLTIKELADTVISHDFGARQGGYCHHDQWKRHLQHQQQQKELDGKRAATPQDERQIIRIAQAQKYHVEPVSPPESNHWSEQNFRRYQHQQQQSHNISALDYVKNRIVEVMRTEDDKKEVQESSAHVQDKDRSDSPGEMVIDEEKHEGEHSTQGATQQPTGYSSYSYVTHKPDNTANDSSRNSEPKPLLSAQYEPLSDED